MAEVFEANRTLDRALRRIFWKKRVPLRTRIDIRKALRDPEKREEIEFSLSRMAVDSNAIPPEGEDVDEAGIFVGNWITDLFDWLLDNWDSILAMIMQIIDLFTDDGEADTEKVV